MEAIGRGNDRRSKTGYDQHPNRRNTGYEQHFNRRNSRSLGDKTLNGNRNDDQPLKIPVVEELFRCDDGTSLLDRTLKDLLAMKDMVEEIYGKDSFYDVAGNNII